ncbi:MAG: CDP-alcohol phosphatidyltransferase family protein [Mesorhizobium sp.]
MTIPNLITILRFLLVPAVVLAMLQARWDWAFAGFAVAGISDGVDGFIARHFNQHSRLGAYMDPMADKLLLVSVFVVLGIAGELPLWLVVLAVSRDALIVFAVLLSSVMGQPVEMKPLVVSKLNTAVQLVLAALVLAELAFGVGMGMVRPALIILSGLLTVASAAAYLVAWLRHMSGYGEGGTSST